MTEKTNPAVRLHSVFTKVLATRTVDAKMLEIWSDVLGVSPKGMDVCRGLIAIQSEIEQLRVMVKAITQDHARYLGLLGNAERVIDPTQLAVTRRNCADVYLTSEAMVRFEFCNDLLSHHLEEEWIAETDLNEIRENLRELFDAIHASTTLDLVLRTALLRLLNAASEAIAEYQISGAAGLKDALQSIVGFIVSNTEALKEAKRSDQSVLDRLGRLLDKLDKFTTAMTKGYRILSKPVRALIGLTVDYLTEDDSSPPGESDIPDLPDNVA